MSTEIRYSYPCPFSMMFCLSCVPIFCLSVYRPTRSTVRHVVLFIHLQVYFTGKHLFNSPQFIRFNTLFTMASANSSTGVPIGYGPRNRLYFDGEQEHYELWEVKFFGHLRIVKLHSVIEDSANGEDSEAAEQNADFSEKNKTVFADLVQYLDDKSLSLVIRDARDDGRKALKILREHYLGSSAPRLIAMYTELTSLKKSDSETVTDYMLRAETTATQLKNAGETISDGLLVAMLLKGLPSSFQAFSTVITQKGDVKFEQFKSSLKSYEENEKARIGASGCDNVLKFSASNKSVCYQCGKPGHKKYECRSKPKDDSAVQPVQNQSAHYSKRARWCHVCKSSTHDTNYCRKKNSAKFISDNEECEGSVGGTSYVFRVSVHDAIASGDIDGCKLLVDCGATTHIVTDPSKFVTKDDCFDSSKHFIELADGSRKNNIPS